jgi:preprotein translocase SecE subunit
MSKLAAPLAYLRQVKVELDQVRWPNHRDTLRLTIVVVAGSVVVGGYVGGLDILFINLLQRLIGY